MFLHEIEERKKHIELKIKYVDLYLQRLVNLQTNNKEAQYNRALDYKFSLLSKLRSHNILIQNLYETTTLTIGDSTITLYEAQQLLSTVENKLKTVESIINKDDFLIVDFFKFIENYDSLIEEYILLYSSIKKCITGKEWEN